MDKYRVKLGNGRIVGPLEKDGIGELFSRGHINGKESFQVFPSGDWGGVDKFPALKVTLKDLILHSKKVKKEAKGDSTIARITIPSKSDPPPSGPNEEKKITSENPLEELREFKFTKETSTGISYKELQERYDDSEDGKKEEGLDKTQLIKRPLQKTFDKTKIVNPKELLKEEVITSEEMPTEDLEKEVTPEEPEEVIDANEKTGFVNLKDVMADIKAIARESEVELEAAAAPAPEVKDSGADEMLSTISRPVKENKKKKIIIVALALLLLYLFFGETEKVKAFRPVYVEFEFPRIKERLNEAKANKLLKEGMALYIKGSYLNRFKASKKFLASLNEKYEGNLALGMLVRSYAELLPEAKNPNKAKTTIDRLIQVSRSKVLSDENLTLGISKFYSYLEKHTSAKRTIENYLRVNKKTIDIFSYYLYILVETGDYVKAKRIFDRLNTSKNKTAITYYYMAFYLRANEEFSKQGSLLKKAVELRPNSVMLWLALCENLFVDGEYALLSKALDKIKKLRMEYSPHYYSKYLEYRGMLKALNGNILSGVELLKKALKFHETNALRSKLAALELHGDEAVQALIEESKIKDFMRKAKEALRSKSWTKAFQYAIEAVDLNESYIPSQLLLADIQSKRGYYQAAIETTRYLKKEFPANPDAAFAYINSLMEAEKMSEANMVINQLTNSTQFFKLPKFQGLIANYWLKLGNFNVALRYFQLALKNDPLNDDYYFTLAREFYKRKRFKEANRYLSRCLDLDPDNIYFLSLKSNIIYELGGPDRAIGYLRDVLKTFPDNPKLLGEIAIYYYRSGKTNEFNLYKKKLENLSKKDGDFYKFMIKSSRVEGNDEGVIFYSRKLIKSDPGNIKVRMVLGEFLLKTNRNELALKEFREVAKRLNTYPRIHYNVALSYIKLGQLKKALISGTTEIRENPTLAYGYYVSGEVHRLMKNYAKATTFFEQAISRDSKMVEALIGLGFVKYKNELYEPARQFYLKALKEEPNNPEVHKRLGYIYNASGQSILGAESFETYLRLAPGARDRAIIEKYIRALR